VIIVAVRILAYNIWDGGADRLGAIAALIRGERPDAVALVETTAASAAALADRLGLDHAFGEGNSVFGVDVSWLSRRPVRRPRNHRLPPLAKTLLEVEVDGLRLFATHLASRHEEHVHPREGEIRAILGVLERVDGPHLLVGDFNALRPGDPVGAPPPGVEPRGEALPGAPRTVLAPLAAAGYVDCYRALHDKPGYTYPADAPWLRLDYAFASRELAPRLAACDVVASDLAARASDHLPLVVELRS
jgi:endonuclease/exonuclease/phosphatase family metal-dependent hydrolase